MHKLIGEVRRDAALCVEVCWTASGRVREGGGSIRTHQQAAHSL